MKTPKGMGNSIKTLVTMENMELNYSALKDGDSNFNLIVF